VSESVLPGSFQGMEPSISEKK